MTFILKEDRYKIDGEGRKIPDPDIINSRYHLMNQQPEKKEEKIKFELVSIFDLPLIVIFRNIANTFMGIINELTMSKTYSSKDSLVKTFIKDKRLLYIGIFMIFLSLFLSFFFI